ncbi:S-adenosyl-L-methionine-dependent methyltransferase [Cladochytrium replicatum]|nr:S-adenosyl-L-methionine-dependent methyltransferase [Cladochytrium replicatum]
MGNTLQTLRVKRQRTNSLWSYTSSSSSPPSSLPATSPTPSDRERQGSLSSVSSTPSPDPLLRFFVPSPPVEVTQGSKLALQQYYLVKQRFHPTFSEVSQEELDSGMKVLDAGAQTGIWLKETVKDFPKCDYFALDLTFSVWPDIHLMKLDKKVRIVETDSLGRIPFKEGVFDYVHEQANLFITPETEWTDAFREMTRVLKPGGYLEIVEVDPIPLFPENAPMADFLSQTLARLKIGSFEWHSAKKISDHVEATNSFTDIQVVRCTIPIGWDGELGRLCRIHMHSSMMGIMPLIATVKSGGSGPQPSEQELNKFCEGFFDACSVAHAYVQVFRITARKRRSS